tara:strand:+ start:115 stop:510 length:396 start_codon:yes stop_codon:yes gene_type:complete
MDDLDKFIEELGLDTRLDELNVRDVQLRLPGIKHKWAGRLIRAKIDLNTLRKYRKKTVIVLAERLIDESPIKLSVPMAEKKACVDEQILDIEDRISDCKVLIEFLEKAERIINSMTFDIKNVAEIMKLETL